MVATGDLSEKHQVVVNYYLRGYTKRAAMTKAGYSKNTEVESVFGRPDVVEVIMHRQDAAAKSADMDREYLLRKLKVIIDADPGELIEIDQHGRASINFDRMSPNLRKAIRKITATSTGGGKKWSKSKTTVSIDVPDVIAAIREAAILLGVRQESLKIEGEVDLINRLQKGLEQVDGTESKD